MPLSRQQKEDAVKEAADALKGAHMIVMADFKGLNVLKSQDLRRKVKKGGGSLKVMKKTLGRLALEQAGLPNDALKGYKDTLAIAAHKTEDSVFAKIFTQAMKDTPELSVVAGIMDGRTMDRAEVLALATLPTREELLSMLLGTLSAPASAFVRVMNGPASGFTRIINGLATK